MGAVLVKGGTVVDAYGERLADVRTGADGRVVAVAAGLDPLPGEETRDNNSLRRLVNVETRKPRILYMEGEPRWEFKFIRRAAEDDRSLQLASMLRTTQNKIYYQGFSDAHKPDEGFAVGVDVGDVVEQCVA